MKALRTPPKRTTNGRSPSGLPMRRPVIALSYAILSVGVAVALVPFLYVLSTSFKETTSLFSYPPDWIPSPVFWGNIKSLFEDHPFVRWTINTLFVAGVVTALKLWFDSMAGYALAKMEFAGKRGIALVFLLSVAIPISALIIPLFFVVRYLGLLNTYWALILPPLANPLGIFMARSFIVGIPDELEASARLDGASEFTIYRKIVLPWWCSACSRSCCSTRRSSGPSSRCRTPSGKCSRSASPASRARSYRTGACSRRPCCWPPFPSRSCSCWFRRPLWSTISPARSRNKEKWLP